MIVGTQRDLKKGHQMMELWTWTVGVDGEGFLLPYRLGHSEEVGTLYCQWDVVVAQ